MESKKKLLQLQKKIFDSLKDEADQILGKTPEAIRKYDLEYRREYRSLLRSHSVRHLEKKKLIEAIRSVDVSFIADYHTFHQAQRTALRLIRDSVRPGENWYLGLEFVPSRFQNVLDLFQEDKISVQNFHQQIRYREEWGFPWSNYEPLFRWSRENDVRLIALNRPKEITYQELHERDEWAAGIITDLFAQSGSKDDSKSRITRMMVLYGELHISQNHLPAALRKVSSDYLGKPLSSVSVHQNIDDLYWMLSENSPRRHQGIIQLKRNSFCVFSSTPWAKLQSLISWAEGGSSALDLDRSMTQNASASDEELEELEENTDEIDHLGQMKNYSHLLAEFFGVKSPSYESISVRTIHEAGFLDSSHVKNLFSKLELHLLNYLVETNHRLYIPKLNIAYLGSPSPNGIAELASAFLLKKQTRQWTLYRSAIDDFYRQVIEAAFSFLGSLMINPKRKCDLPRDHVQRLERLKKKLAPPTHPFEVASRSLALEFLIERDEEESQDDEDGPQLLLKSYLKKPKVAAAVALGARYVGQVLGKKTHQAMLDGKLSSEDVTRLFLKSLRRFESHRFRYMEIGIALAEIQLSPSKTDVI